MEFSAACLSYDAKNYHAWAHRQAILTAFNTPPLWSQELLYVQELIDQDIRNNSAWNQRAFVLQKAPENKDHCLLPPEQRYNTEHDYVAGKILLVAHNESAWAYLGGLVTWPAAPPAALATDRRFEKLCVDVLKQQPSCVPALRLLADVYAEKTDGQQLYEQLRSAKAKMNEFMFELNNNGQPAPAPLSSSAQAGFTFSRCIGLLGVFVFVGSLDTCCV